MRWTLSFVASLALSMQHGLAAPGSAPSTSTKNSTSSQKSSVTPSSRSSAVNSASGSMITPAPNATIHSNGTVGWLTSGTNPVIPGIVAEYCPVIGSLGNQGTPCDVTCAADDPACISVALAEVKTCAVQWNSYSAASASWASKFLPGFTTYTDTGVSTITVQHYPHSSVDTSWSYRNYFGSYIHPVYVWGSPVVSTSKFTDVLTWTFARASVVTDVPLPMTITTQGILSTETGDAMIPLTSGFPEQTPYCKFTEATTMECSQCTIGGGSVKMYYWPVPSSTASGGSSNKPSPSSNSSQTAPVTAVVNGITMTSPSVYISMQTAFASNSCRAVGGNYSGSILTMAPNHVSTVFGSGPGYLPHQAKRINYADLQDFVPGSVYEQQATCAHFGCPTIFNDEYRPTLAIPPQIRSLDPAWANCALDLNGVYDPPTALQPATATIDGPNGPSLKTTSSSDEVEPTTSAEASPTPSSPSPSETGGNEGKGGTTTTAQPSDASKTGGSGKDGNSASPTSGGNGDGTQTSVTESGGSNDGTPTSGGKGDGTQTSSGTGSGGGGGGNDGTNESNGSSATPSVGDIIASVLGISSDATSDATKGDNGANTSPASITIGNNVVTANSASQFVFGSQTVSAGGSALTLSGSTYSIEPSGKNVVVNGQTQSIAQQQQQQNQGVMPTVVSVAGGGSTSAVLVAGSTLFPGSSLVVSGTTYSVAPSGSGVVVNGQTQSIAQLQQNQGVTPTVVSVAGRGSTSAVLVDGSTLLPGNSLVVSGTTYSVAPSGSGVVVNGQTFSISGSDVGTVAGGTLPDSVAGIKTTLVSGKEAVIIGSQTLFPGESLTVAGPNGVKESAIFRTSSGTGEVEFEDASTTRRMELGSLATTISSSPSSSSPPPSTSGAGAQSVGNAGGPPPSTSTRSGSSTAVHVPGMGALVCAFVAGVLGL